MQLRGSNVVHIVLLCKLLQYNILYLVDFNFHHVSYYYKNRIFFENPQGQVTLWHWNDSNDFNVVKTVVQIRNLKYDDTRNPSC